MNTLTKKIIRIWIALFSFVAFTIGWITLSHSDTTATSIQSAAVTQPAAITTGSEIEFDPIPTLEELTQNSQTSTNTPGFTVTTRQSSANMPAAPRLRTMGS